MNNDIASKIKIETESDEEPHQIISFTLYEYLCKMKRQIEDFHEAWDNIKKYTNPYEFIHTTIPNYKTSISKMKPLSRSFYKMIEIYELFEYNKDFKEGEEFESFHLAEGPGGFIEALTHIRSGRVEDKYVGMTLQNADSSCPGWKKSKYFLDLHKNVEIENGEDGTGNLLNINNLKYIREKYKNKCNLVTADGGFDFSCDFNKQEKIVAKLLIAEMTYGIAIQKKGGHFVLKIFDIFSKPTLDILYILSNLYKEVYIMKPNTSRYANSEKYIICKYFKKENSEEVVDRLMMYFDKLVNKNEYEKIYSVVDKEHDYYFISKIEEINAILGQQQIENIGTTINIIINKINPDKLDTMKKNNITKCVNWCEKFGIPHNRNVQPVNIFLPSIS